MWLRTRKRNEPVDWDQRMGVYKLPKDLGKPRLWLHAVSVGEVVAAKPILQELRKLAPQLRIVLSVTTSSGHKTAREQLGDLYDVLVYIPIDVVRFQWRAMAAVRPDVVAIMETELWMNFLSGAKEFDARTLLINGRISDKNWRISKHLLFFYRSLFQRVDRVLAQGEVDCERLQAMGARDPEVFGNTKFDQATEAQDVSVEEIRRAFEIPEGRRVVVVGSTRSEAEEELVVKAIRGIGLHNLTVIHAPRHIERAIPLGQLVEATFGEVAYRSRKESSDYLILDTYGELSKVYALADVVVIGGGFDNLGGQNLIQPLALGKPVLHGPNMQNFRDVAQAALDAGATRICATAEELRAELERLLEDPAARAKMGAAARQLVQANLGASKRYAQAIVDELNAPTPSGR